MINCLALGDVREIGLIIFGEWEKTKRDYAYHLVLHREVKVVGTGCRLLGPGGTTNT
jgi:hypothetical protein